MKKAFKKRWPVARRGFGLVPVKNSGIRELPAAIRSEWSDGDTLLVLVDPKGPACHTGRYSCFFNPIEIMKEGNANDTAES